MKSKACIALMIVVLLPATFFASCGKKAQPERAEVPVIEALDKDALGKMTDFRYTRTVEGRKEFEVKAHSAVYFDNGKKAEFEKASIAFYSKDGTHLVLTADRGTVMTDSKDIEASGNVIIESDEGYRVGTDKLSYKDAEKLIYTDEPILLASEKISVSGVGLRLFIEDQKLEILQSVMASAAR